MKYLGTKGLKAGVQGFVAGLLIALLVGLGFWGEMENWFANRPAPVMAQVGGVGGESEVSFQRLPNFVNLAKQLRPVVVNISTTQVNEGAQMFPSPFGGEEDPFSEFWKRFFGQPFPRGPQRQKSLGSGFIIGSDGSILTNNHVIENAERIVVRLADERELEAKVLGRDPKTDIAIIKVEAADKFPTANLGNSDGLEVGEWVLAIGNPFGLDSTVTSGIVSAKGRHIGAGPYDDFIQTDASINPGNSGGPLINMRGDVVGINTAIFSRTGGNIGIGFAIPINLVKELLPQLIKKGKVTRGWLGVVIQRVTQDIAESLGMSDARGALVANVAKGGPAELAGIKIGDVIVEYDGRNVEESNDLPLLVARTRVGDEVRVKVLRDKKEVTVKVTIGELKEEEALASLEKTGDLGLAVQKVTPQIAESLGLEKVEGVVVTSVKPGSAADDAGLRRGDVVLEIDRKAIRDLSDYRKALAGVKKGKGILFLVRRGDNTLFLALRSRE